MTEHILEKVCDLYFPLAWTPKECSAWSMNRFDALCWSSKQDFWEGFLYQKKDENNS
jgi:hypothetical protein